MTEPSQPRSNLSDALTFQLDERDIELIALEEEQEDSFAAQFSEDRERLDVWKKYASYADTSAPSLFERINQVQSVLAILRACLPEAKNLEALESQLIEAAQRTASLSSSGFDTDAADVEQITDDLSRIEETLVQAERKVPLSWLRHQTDEHDFGDVALAHYLRFQIQFLKIAPKSWTRIDLIVSRLAAARETSGIFHVRSTDEVGELLSACLPPSDTQPHVRKAATLFFRNAARRLEEFQHEDELFTSGFYVDVLGYMLSLRYDYFDPPIMYASAELSLAIEDWVENQQGTTMRALDPQFAQAREKVRKIFGRGAGDVGAATKPQNSAFSEQPSPYKRRATAAASTTRARASGTTSHKDSGASFSWSKLLVFGAFGLALIWVAPTALSWFQERQRDLQSVSDSETAEISAVLREGNWAGKGQGKIFIGEVDGGQWALLNDAQKRTEAQKIRQRLGHRGVTAAFVYNNGTMVINIMQGELRYLE